MMKKINFFLILLISFMTMGSVIAQAPQGVNYQGVATNSEGNVLSNQDVKVKLSLLNESTTGTEEWVETHLVTTDEFGLFCLVFGEGERIDGLAATFEEVSWSQSEKFLQVDVDLTGGDDFTLLGTNKIMSVPYALECKSCDEVRNEKQTLEYDGTSGDLTLVTPNGDNSVVNIQQSLNYDESTGDLNLIDSEGNIGSSINLNSGSFGAPGASYDFPNGLIGQYGFLGNEEFTVPAGMVMFLTNSDAEVTIVNALGIFAEFEHTTTPNMAMFPAGTKVKKCKCSYFLTEEMVGVEAVLINLTESNSTYLVPAGKALFIKSGLDGDDPIELTFDGVEYKFLKPNETRSTRIITIPGGVLMSKSGADMDHPRILSGFLLDN